MLLLKFLVFLIPFISCITISGATNIEALIEEKKVLSTIRPQSSEVEQSDKRTEKKPRVIALVGAGGTGKTSVIEELKKIRPDWFYLSESTRTIVPILGYSNPWNIVDEVGIAFYESMVISHWCIIDTKSNPFFRQKNIICIVDRSPLDNLAYYYSTRQENEYRYEHLLKSLSEHYARCIDLYLFFPTGVIPLVQDNMRLENLEYQKKYEKILWNLLEEYKLNVHKIEKKLIEERTDEVIKIIEKLL